jgi:hypothetical protein
LGLEEGFEDGFLEEGFKDGLEEGFEDDLDGGFEGFEDGSDGGLALGVALDAPQRVSRTSEKDSTCISPFVHPNVHVITCSSFIWPEMHASTEEFTWFL